MSDAAGGTALRSVPQPATGGPPLRIAQIAPPWIPVPPTGYGGIERVVADLVDHLVARGHEVTLFAAAGSETTARLRTPLPATPTSERLGNTIDDTTHTLIAHLARDEFDVVHDHTGIVGAALAAVRPGGAPVVQTLHGAWTPTTRLAYRTMGERVGLVAISDAQRRSNPEVVHATTIHNGVEPARFPIGAPAREERLVFIGRSSEEKAPVDAIRIARAAGLALTILVKCAEPAERAYWHDVVEPELGDDVTVVFDADDATKVDVLGRSLALVFPIRWEEPFGMVMVEAMACGTPVIANRRGSVPEVVVDGVTGFHVRPEDPIHGAVRALSRIDGIDRVACRSRVEEHFSSARMAARYEALFRRLVADRADPPTAIRHVVEARR